MTEVEAFNKSSPYDHPCWLRNPSIYLHRWEGGSSGRAVSESRVPEQLAGIVAPEVTVKLMAGGGEAVRTLVQVVALS